MKTQQDLEQMKTRLLSEFSESLQRTLTEKEIGFLDWLTLKMAKRSDPN